MQQSRVRYTALTGNQCIKEQIDAGIKSLEYEKMEGITRWEITARPTEGGLWEYKQNMLQEKHFRKDYKVTGPITVDGLAPTLDHWVEQFCQD